MKEAGFTGRVDILKECARRWAIHKQVGTSNAPLMLMSEASSSSDVASEASTEAADGLIEAIAELPEEELRASLAANGLPVSDHHANAVALAGVMMA